MSSSFSECEPNWQVRIEDAILEKCEGIQGILHLSVDKNSKEVNINLYLKKVSLILKVLEYFIY